MASFTAGTTFVDGVSNDVTAAKLGALVTNATPTSGFIQDRTAETIIATNDTLLIGDASDSNNLKRITVANFAQTLPTANVTTGTIETGTFGTTTSTAATITTGTIPTGTFGTTTSTAATITTGTIPTLVATTLITTGTGTAAAPAIVPTGDTNTGIFFPAADTIAFSEGGTEAMRINSSGQVGIGSTAPNARLIASVGASPNFAQLLVGYLDGSENYYDANTHYFRNGSSTEKMRIDSSGRVGINVTSPLYKLQVDGDAALTDTSSLIWATAGGTTRTSIAGDSSGNLKLQTGASNTERMRIDASGNVGIGITPSQKLDVNGNSVLRGTIFVGDTASAVIRKVAASTPLYFANQAGAIETTIDGSGQVGIGTTSPSGTLHSVSASASVTPGIFAITATSSTATPAVAIIKQDSLTTTNQSFVLFQVGGGTNCGKINANGANTAAFGSTSDARLKENITALPSQIDNVCALKPCEFDYKDGSGHQIGFIAQEMQQIYPDAVGVGDDGMLTITAWSKTEARLVKAIQELKAKNDSLEARLRALEAR